MQTHLIPMLLLTALCSLSGCAKHSAYISNVDASRGTLSDATLQLNSSTGGPLDVHQAALLTDNDAAFSAKLALIRSAQRSLDLVYYIFGDDFSSSLFSAELLAAAQRGVRVRLLVDYFVNYQRLDFFEMLEQYGNTGAGSLQVRFFNRPTDSIIHDAAYVTLGCAGAKRDEHRECSREKFQLLEEAFRRYRQEYGPPDPRVPSNFNNGDSGIFLSAIYAQNGALLTEMLAKAKRDDPKSQAVPSGGAAPDAQRKTAAERDKALRRNLAAGGVFWKSRNTNPDELERIGAKMKLSLAFLLFGGTLNPLYDMISAYFPIDRPANSAPALRDWQFLTQFTHHKFLFADGQRLIIGGRNVEDSYHMRKNALTPHYVFMDTDLDVELNIPSERLTAAFESLWDFRAMTASLADVRLHAPNDYLQAFIAAQEKCGRRPKPSTAGYESCVEEAFLSAPPPAQRINKAHQEMLQRSQQYKRDYVAADAGQQRPSFTVDSSAALYYLENLPFNKDSADRTRLYGVKSGLEGESGRYIHNVWLGALRNACRQASPEHPQHVLLHNAYFLLPAAVTRQLAQMVDGSLDCGNVQITVLTNSPQTTDLRVINLAARYWLKAFSEYVAHRRDPKKGASFRYLEYLSRNQAAEASDFSLHSKVLIAGEDMFVGSANADVRSYMLDTNNGIFLRNAPKLRQAYLAWIERLIQDKTLIRDETAFFDNATIEQLLQHDEAAIRHRLVSVMSLADPAGVPQPLVDWLLGRLTKIYKLTGKILEQGWRSKLSEEKYDDSFKLF